MMRDKNVRLADWAGPTNMHRIRPKIQNTVAPWARVANSRIAHTLMPISETTISGLGPSRSSRRPEGTVATPAMTVAATPKHRPWGVDRAEANVPDPAAEGEHAGQAVPEDRAGQQEPDRVAADPPDAADVAEQHAVTGQEPGPLGRDRSGRRRHLDREEHREAEPGRPRGGDQHG